MAVKPIPDDYHTLTPYLIVRDADKAIAFYQEAFGATELMRMTGPNGKIGHAELKIGDSVLMLSEENPKWGATSPMTLGGTPLTLAMYVVDVDASFNKAVQAGATVKRPLADQFYGDRSGTLTDPYGHVWTLATHKEDVSHEEMSKRMEEFMKKMPSE
jgi:PhnB protein